MPYCNTEIILPGKVVPPQKNDLDIFIAQIIGCYWITNTNALTK